MAIYASNICEKFESCPRSWGTTRSTSVLGRLVEPIHEKGNTNCWGITPGVGKGVPSWRLKYSHQIVAAHVSTGVDALPLTKVKVRAFGLYSIRTRICCIWLGAERVHLFTLILRVQACNVCRQASDKPSNGPTGAKIHLDCFNRKCQDYVYVKWEYWNTMQKINHYSRLENKANENKVS